MQIDISLEKFGVLSIRIFRIDFLSTEGVFFKALVLFSLLIEHFDCTGYIQIAALIFPAGRLIIFNPLVKYRPMFFN